MNINSRGLSLVELVIVVGALSGAALLVMNLTKQTTKSSTKYQLDSDIIQTTNEINAILSDPIKCLNTFGTTATPSSINGKFKTIAGGGPTEGYGNGRLEIESYTLSVPDPVKPRDGLLSILYKNKNILKEQSKIDKITKQINLYIEGTLGAITACRALSVSSTDIWSRGAGSNIYYSGGNVGIGMSTAPTARLEVTGNVKVNGTINASGTITSTSDRRFKKNFNSLDKSLEKILNLQGITFNWQNESMGQKRQIGFIAQEVERIYPELVYTDSQGIKSVAYQNLVAPLVEAIREQQSEIDELKQALCQTNPSLKICKNYENKIND